MDMQALFTPEMLMFSAAGFAGIAFLTVLMHREFTYGIYAWLLAVLFFKYNKFGMEDSMMPDLSIVRALFLFIIALFTIEILTKKRRIYPISLVEAIIFLFSLYIVMSMMYTGFILKEGERLRIGDFLTGFIFPYVMFFISKNVYGSHEKREGFIKFIVLIGVYLSLTAIFEHFGIKELVFPRYIMDPDVGIHFGRARGPFVVAAVNGNVLGFVFLGCLYFLFGVQKRGLWRIFLYILLMLTSVALFFTYTRGCWLSAIAGCAVLVLFFKEYRKSIAPMALIALLIFTILGAFFLLGTDTSFFAIQRFSQKEPVYDRLNLYLTYINIFRDYPVFGVGFGQFPEYLGYYFKEAYYHLYQPSMYLQGLDIHDTFGGILAELGILGILFTGSIYALIISKGMRLYRGLAADNMKERALVPLFFAILAAYLVNALFMDTRYFEFVNCIVFIFCGIICGLERERHEKRLI